MAGRSSASVAPSVHLLNSESDNRRMIERYLQSLGNDLYILEAGCGRYWPLKLDGTTVHLTGIDLDETALSARRDLERAHVADLRTVQLQANSFDVVYCAFVLEHIDGAERVLKNFAEWVRPGGLIVLQFPDRNTAFGFLTRWTPLWAHAAWKRWIEGTKTAGQPGHAPYPVVYDSICTITGIREFCRTHGLEILEEHGHGYYTSQRGGSLMRAVMRTVSALSLGKFAWRYNNLTLILRRMK